jgi:toxin CcdB
MEKALMAQFDVYRNPYPATAGRIPYFVDIQTGHLGGLATCVVVPLAPRDGYPAAAGLNPTVTLEGVELVLATAELAAVYRDSLGDRVGSLADRREEIVAAIDFLVRGL